MVTIATGNMGDCEAFITDEADLDALQTQIDELKSKIN